MKKALIILLAFVLITSCAQKIDSHFTPPKWIQGTWLHDDESMFEFLEDDVIDITGNIRQSKKKMYKPEWLFDVVKNRKEYSYTIRIEDVEQTSRYVKIAKDTLEYSLLDKGELLGTLVLVRK